MGPLNAVAACVRSKTNNVFLPSSSEELHPANYLANTAGVSQSSSESDLTWPSLPSGTTDLHIRAHFSGSSIQGGLGGAGINIFLDYLGGSSELFSCGFILGKRTSANSALLQACGCTLLAVFTILFRLSDNSTLLISASSETREIDFPSLQIDQFLQEGLQLLRLPIRSGLNLLL